jgi:hypothetical protein
MTERYAPRASWQLRLQRKLGADYIRGQSSARRKAAVVAAVAVVHIGIVAGFLSWRVTVAEPPLLVKVHLIPAGAIRILPRRT